MKNIKRLNLTANANADIRPLSGMKKANVQGQKIILNEANMSDTSRLRLFDPAGKLPENNILKDGDK
ncbi:hypothetical protein DT250_03430 [Bacillus sp. AR2-1]|uniref:hypothetical protein n=1 Tax=Bacillus sp. AR2-1 TaxID=2217816 RepID=UPI0011EE6C54|nr:hypothetical protein [Bacillus sp. AR2-1]KAA0777207.1 hypothetical protein DT250_03430 [Bacillus sp. AR2-1]